MQERCRIVSITYNRRLSLGLLLPDGGSQVHWTPPTHMPNVQNMKTSPHSHNTGAHKALHNRLSLFRTHVHHTWPLHPNVYQNMWVTQRRTMADGGGVERMEPPGSVELWRPGADGSLSLQRGQRQNIVSGAEVGHITQLLQSEPLLLVCFQKA